jgi:putative ABC transport system permease protein
MAAISPLLPVVGVVMLLTAVFMLRDKIISRLALRNVSRRKAAAALVIAGLFIGTAMITGALVTGDTMNALFTRPAYLGFGGVDEGVYTLNSQGGYALFNYSVYSQAAPRLLGIADVAGVTPMAVSAVSLFDNSTGVGQSGVVLIGVDQNATAALGNFTTGSGSVIDPDTGAAGVILNLPAATDLNASVGDTIRVIGPASSGSFTVQGIDQSFDRSGFPGNTDHAVVSLPAAQALLGAAGEINFIAITNSGGVHEGVANASKVGPEANITVSSYTVKGGGQLYAFGNKDEAVTAAAKNAQNLSSFMLVASSFTIIAGVVLIVNIFVMLAEERKREMGMARAVGMKRLHLMKAFLFEGTQYALVASLVGVVAGIAIAYAVLYIIGSILIGVVASLNTSAILQSFTFSPETLVLGFSAGLLITYATIVLASWRVSKLNIIKAIRDVPEPPAGGRTYTWLSLLGFLLLVVGVLMFFEGRSRPNLTLFLVGPSLSIFGAGLALSRFVKSRYALTASSLGVLAYWSYPLLSWRSPLAPSSTGGAPTTVDIAAGMLMVFAGVLLVMYNTGAVVEGLTRMLRARPSWLPVVKIGLSYPGSKKFRTGVTVFMVALVMFSVVFTSVLISVNKETQAQTLKADSGGYDLVATTQFPVQDLAGAIGRDSNVSSSISGVSAFSGGYVLTTDVSEKDPVTSYTQYLGANSSAAGKDNFFDSNTFNMTSAMPAYLLPGGKVDAQKVWAAVQSNPDLVVLSVSAFRPYGSPAPSQQAGDVESINLPDGSVANATIVATLAGGALSGLLSTAQFVDARMHTSSSQFALVSLADSGQGDSVAINMKRDSLSSAMQVTVIPDVLAKELSTSNSFYTLFEGFFALGLIVGIAGLSIISIRAIVERRQEIGMVRALGFTKRMVLGSFLLENSFVAVLGILIGALLAIDLGYPFATSIPNVSYAPPLLGIAEIMVVVYGFAMIGTVFSAMRAARTTPAEALRYNE